MTNIVSNKLISIRLVHGSASGCFNFIIENLIYRFEDLIYRVNTDTSKAN